MIGTRLIFCGSFPFRLGDSFLAKRNGHSGQRNQGSVVKVLAAELSLHLVKRSRRHRHRHPKSVFSASWVQSQEAIWPRCECGGAAPPAASPLMLDYCVRVRECVGASVGGVGEIGTPPRFLCVANPPSQFGACAPATRVGASGMYSTRKLPRQLLSGQALFPVCASNLDAIL